MPAHGIRGCYFLLAFTTPKLIKPKIAIDTHDKIIEMMNQLKKRGVFVLAKSGDVTSNQRYSNRLSKHATDVRQRTHGQPINCMLHDDLQKNPTYFAQLVMIPDLRFDGETEMREWYESNYGVGLFSNSRASNTGNRERFPKIEMAGDYIRYD